MIKIIDERLRDLKRLIELHYTEPMGDPGGWGIRINELEVMREKIEKSIPSTLRDTYEKARWMAVSGERITVSKEPPKTFYHTFSMDDRIVIICLLSCEKVNVGYSVKSPMDTFNRELGKKIALGRAKKTPLRSSVMDYSRDKGVLKSVAKYWEMKIRKGLIKGTKTKKL